MPWFGSVIDDAPSYLYASPAHMIDTGPVTVIVAALAEVKSTAALTVNPSTDVVPAYLPVGTALAPAISSMSSTKTDDFFKVTLTSTMPAYITMRI